ncbi:MAG: WYL domain-containing protein [Bacteroidia bacterium]|nr:WYL domain-containing protein [Bacteroidia bacterium]
MASSRLAGMRYQIIDQELRSRDYVKTSELKRIIERKLNCSISKKQINDDVIAMRDDSLLKFYAPIVYNKSKKAYQYSDRNYSIKGFALREEEILALRFHAASLHLYREHSLFKDFSNALEKVVNAVDIHSSIGNSSKLIVQTDNVSDSGGSEFLAPIAQAIDGRMYIKFMYCKFGELEKKERIMAAYLLKEYRNRWYVIGKLKDSRHILTFALDRITELSTTGDKYQLERFDADSYFKHSFGITRPDTKPLKLVLLFTPAQGKYVKSLPIHSTQKVIYDDDRGFKVQIDVMPSYELIEYLVGQGESVKVISPKSIADEVINRHRNAVRRYKK